VDVEVLEGARQMRLKGVGYWGMSEGNEGGLV
jgi:hypothetical protein